MFLENVASVIDRVINEKGVPGGAIRVYKDHTPIFEYSAGYEDKAENKPFTTSSLVYLYSTSKVITCAAALSLMEKGKFLLSEPLSRYIPEFENVKVRIKKADGTEELKSPAWPGIRIGQLFTMTAGLNYDLNSKSILELKKENPKASTLEFVKAIAKEPLDFEPGTHWQYSLCHDVLGGLVEKTADMPFGEYVKENIFEKCGMKNSTYQISDELKEKISTQYRFFPEKGIAEKVEKEDVYILGENYHSGGAGVISNADDYILFADALACGGLAATGERILAPQTVELMKTEAQKTKGIPGFEWDQYLGYGYGLGVRTLLDKTVGGSLSPIGEFGWGGAAGTLALIDTQNRLSFYYTQHMLNPFEAWLFPRLRNTVYADLSRAGVL